MRTVVFLAALALAVVPAVHAKDASSALAIESVGQSDPSPIPFAGKAAVSVQVGVGCAAVLQAVGATAAGSHTAVATVTVEKPPSWLTVAPGTATFDASTCPTATDKGYLVANARVNLTVSPGAPGVVPFSLNFTATMPGVSPASQVAPSQSNTFNVTYYANHTITPSIHFPYTMTGHWLNFTVTVTQGANARSMVMFENLRADRGTVSGLASIVYEPPQTKTFQVTYVAPDSDWTQAN
ncbi:MAG: hypothetical protein LC620_04725, partial [Halobacteriales archaeon]|nr:hypothetical protein [Halobacteriales archaeon]